MVSVEDAAADAGAAVVVCAADVESISMAVFSSFVNILSDSAVVCVSFPCPFSSGDDACAATAIGAAVDDDSVVSAGDDDDGNDTGSDEATWV